MSKLKSIATKEKIGFPIRAVVVKKKLEDICKRVCTVALLEKQGGVYRYEKIYTKGI